MTDCCLTPRPEGMTAHTVGCLLTTHDPTSHVAALRGLVAPAPKEIRP